MSDTPETDVAVLLVPMWVENEDPIAREVIHPSFARRLERERDEARNTLKANSEEWNEVHSEVKAERDDARSLAAEIAIGITHSPDCSDSIPCMRCQRDALREENRKLRESLDEALNAIGDLDGNMEYIGFVAGAYELLEQ